MDHHLVLDQHLTAELGPDPKETSTGEVEAADTDPLRTPPPPAPRNPFPPPNDLIYFCCLYLSAILLSSLEDLAILAPAFQQLSVRSGSGRVC
jgi:hypothetical protein